MNINDCIVVCVCVSKHSLLNETSSYAAKYLNKQALTLSVVPFKQEDNIKACTGKDSSSVGPWRQPPKGLLHGGKYWLNSHVLCFPPQALLFGQLCNGMDERTDLPGSSFPSSSVRGAVGMHS